MENIINTREPNFDNDAEKYGKFGEGDFKEYYKSLGFIVEDVSLTLEFQLSDIDFLISKKPIPMYRYREIINARNTSNREVFKAEVKTDTMAYKTRNIVYEIIAHDSAGCLAASKADFVYYVFVEEVGTELVKREAWSVNLYKWRQYLREKFFDGKVSMDDSVNVWGIHRSNISKDGINSASLLCNIDKLAEHGIAKRCVVKQ